MHGAACLIIVLFLLGAGILAMGHRHSAVAPFRAESVPAPEAAAEATNRAVLELVATLDGNDMRDVNRSLGDLKTMGTAAAPAAPRLTKFLLQNDPTYRGDKMREIQSHALEVLRVIDPNWLSSNQCEQLVIELTEQLERSRHRPGETPYVTEPSETQVAAALGLLGPAARLAVQGLILTCASEDSHSRECAREALKRIDPDWPKSAEAERCVPRLIEIWRSLQNSVAREDVSLTLEQIEPDWFATHYQRRRR